MREVADSTESKRCTTPVAGVLVALGILLLAPPIEGQPRGGGDEASAGLRYGFEVKGHYRDSDPVSFRSPLGFPRSFLPVGQEEGLLETVEPDGHAELSAATVWLEAQFWRHFEAKVKVDLIDRYDRNPTSSDDEIDIDELWLRFGRETAAGLLPERDFGSYAKIGKFAKFERQNDRHLESYGLVSTAFNRAEDVGVEVGFDLWRRFYAKVSYTQGNPVFFRDPNALAGDNGIPILNVNSPDFVPNPDPELKTGFPIFYDADVEDIDFDNPETGLALGLRLGGEDSWSLDLMVWTYSRELADTVDLGGTFYGGDLDLILGPQNAFPPRIPTALNRKKEEYGANLWFYLGNFSLFAQYVDQDLGGLPRTGLEVEASYAFELPYWAALGGRQLFSFVQPTVRYSELDNDFLVNASYPAPSVMWDWEKLDLGLRLGLVDRLLDLTVEWNDNEFVRAGVKESADEFLATVRWAMDWENR